MFLDFGNNKKWTDSSFVLLDGDFAPFQPRLSFQSLPQVNFGWLKRQNVSLDLGKNRALSGILVFAADSEVQLYYHLAEITGENYK